MGYLMYDKFLESYSKVPLSIQGKVRNMLVKLREPNPRHSLNLERIHSFVDQNMMTARVDQAYRAIIYSFPDSEQYAILWVDHHDDAMRWAERKKFFWNNNTQAIQIFEAVEAQSPVPLTIHPEERPGLIGNCTDIDLISIGVPEPLLPSVRNVQSFEDLEKIEPFIPKDVFENLFAILDGKPVNEIIDEIEEGKVASTDSSEQLNSPNNLRNFYVVKDDSDLEQVLEGDLKKWKVFLHPAQRKYSSFDFPGSYKVTGAAGTGKTVLALHRLKYLTEKKKENGRILFTTYTKSLVANLADAVKELKIDPLKIKLTNIHNLIFEMAKEEKLIPASAKPLDVKNNHEIEKIWIEYAEASLSEYDIDFLMREYHQVVLMNNVQTLEGYLRVSRTGMFTPLGRKDRIKVWNIFERFKKNRMRSSEYYIDEATNLLYNHFNGTTQKPFDHVVADEIQDFSVVDLRFLRAIVAEGPNDLFLVGDPMQNIYGKNPNFMNSGINIRGVRSRRLRINYRTTEEIKKGAVAVVKGQVYSDFEGNAETLSGYVSLLKGEAPVNKVFVDTTGMNNGLIEVLNHLVSEETINPEEICIATRIKDTMDDVKKTLHNKFAYFDLATATGTRKGIALSTMHNLKGLEFKVIILYNISKSTFPFYFHNFKNLDPISKKSYVKSERSLMYVAMTRAIKKLYILGVFEPCEWLTDKAEIA